MFQDPLSDSGDVTPSGVQGWDNCPGYQRVKERSCPEVTLSGSAYSKDSESFADKIDGSSQNQ